ncbi:MAG: hypothetical protein U5K75_02445 [Ahrensia sp.]|nr:hypothetical protein [Ahrensia sp.]
MRKRCATFALLTTIFVPVSLDRKRLAEQVVKLEQRGNKRWQIDAEPKEFRQRDDVRRLTKLRRIPKPTNQIDMFG